MALGFPQWQGSGRHENLRRGADAIAGICGQYAPLFGVPLSDESTTSQGVNRWSAIFDQFRAAQDILSLHTPKRVLTAGGDCSVDVAVIDYLYGLYPDLTVIWVDAHLDANSPTTSPSGNFHGMPVSIIMGEAPAPMRHHLRHPLASEKFYYFGARVGDEGDWAFQRERGLAWLGADQSIHGPVHVHFDLDALEPDEFPYLAYPEPDGLSIGDALTLLDRIAEDGDVVGLTFTEFAPANDIDARAGSEIVAKFCAAVARD